MRERWVIFAAVGCVSCILGACVLFSAAQRKAAGQGAGNAQAGQKVFSKNCLPCHSTHEGQTSFGPNLFHEMSKGGADKTGKQVRTIIESGKGTMPPFGGALPPADIDNLIAYLRTL